MFSPVSSRVSFPALESNILQYWKDKDVFHRTATEREDGPPFMLFEGPPTANGNPGIHHVLARVFKDVICRHRTMKGYRCLRKGGWDTHGLPVELEVEKELGLSTKREIEEYGIERFNQKCKESVFHYLKEWETMTDRIAFWVDMDDPYVTLHNDYIETGWWILKELWDKGLLYQDLRGTPHCPRCVTSLSSHEVALGYRENTPDPSVFIKFRVQSFPASKAGMDWAQEQGVPAYLLAWTTTPWTLPGNTALAVDEDAEYSVVELSEGDEDTQRLVLASALLESAVQHEYRTVTTVKGSDLVGIEYQPLYNPSDYSSDVRRFVRHGTKRGDSGVGGNHRVPTSGGSRGLRVYGGRHRHRPYRPGLRRRGLDPGKGKGAALRPARRPSWQRDGGLPVRREVRQRRRRRDHGGPHGPRLAVSQGCLPAYLPLLLALRHASPLLRQEFVVHPHFGA